MAYPRNAPRKQQNETIIAAVVCLALGYALCWIIQVPAQPRVCSCQLCPLMLSVALEASCLHGSMPDSERACRRSQS